MIVMEEKSRGVGFEKGFKQEERTSFLSSPYWCISTCPQRAHKAGYPKSLDGLLRVIDVEKVRIENGLDDPSKNWDRMEKALEEEPVDPIGDI